ncbi:MAG: glycosyltransferase family 4 protein [Thalassobaculaceae bacterium]|nr:glycosyltransferase family 4 protein [Thalassobaculaceae bacterium]
MTEPLEAGATAAPDPNISVEDFEAFRPGHGGMGPTILQLLPALGSGGVERGTVDMARAIVQAGWRALVVSRGGPMVHELERVGGTHITLPIHSKNPLHWRATFDALVDVIHRERVDLVHARSRIPAWHGIKAAARNRVPFVTTFHQRPTAATAVKRAYNSVMVRGERVIAISHYIAERLLADYGMDADRLRVIPRGVDLEMFDPDRVPAERMIRLINKWRLPDGVPVVMMPGRITAWKGHKLLIDALSKLERGSFHCLMVGDDTARPEAKRRLEAYAHATGVGAFVHFVGRTDDMPAAYKLADVVVSASLDPEPFGRVMIEAQSMGRPIVATDHGGARETVLEDETGWLVTPGDAGALAAGLKTALSLDEDARARLSAKAIAHVRAHFSRYQMCARTLSVYTEILSARGCERL